MGFVSGHVAGRNTTLQPYVEVGADASAVTTSNAADPGMAPAASSPTASSGGYAEPSPDA